MARLRVPTFLAGFEAFHALTHAYLGLSKRTKLIGHPAERLGIAVTPRFHAIAAVVNAAIAVGLGAWAWRSSRVVPDRGNNARARATLAG